MKLKSISVLVAAMMVLGCTTTHQNIKSDQLAKKTQSKEMSTSSKNGEDTSNKIDRSQKIINRNFEYEASLRTRFSGIKIYREDEQIRLILPVELSFGSSSASLTGEAKDTLRDIALIIHNYPECKISINGHTDSTGRYETNEALSGLRAQAVADFMRKHGVRNIMKVIGYGETKPIASNMISAGRAANRRVEIILY